jgi:hypothetical protein
VSQDLATDIRLVTDRPQRCGRKYSISGESIVPRSNGPITGTFAARSESNKNMLLFACSGRRLPKRAAVGTRFRGRRITVLCVFDGALRPKGFGSLKYRTVLSWRGMQQGRRGDSGSGFNVAGGQGSRALGCCQAGLARGGRASWGSGCCSGSNVARRSPCRLTTALKPEGDFVVAFKTVKSWGPT